MSILSTTRHRGRALLTVTALALTLGACTPSETLAGMHAPPTENPSVAPLAKDATERITTRVIQGVSTAVTAPADEAGAAARAAVLMGTAADQEKARVTVQGPATAQTSLTRPTAPTVLAMSRGRTFPRSILATTLDEETNRQYLETFSSATVLEPFRLENRVAMLPGATLPGIGAFEAGVPLIAPEDGTGLVASPQASLESYAAAIAFPEPKVGETVDISDSYAKSLAASQKSQSDALGALASYTVTQTVVPESIRAFRLADGSAVVFGRINRTDGLTASETAKELTVPEAYQKLTGTATATSTITIDFLQAVVLHVPAPGKGKVTLLGVGEQVVAGSAS